MHSMGTKNLSNWIIMNGNKHATLTSSFTIRKCLREAYLIVNPNAYKYQNDDGEITNHQHSDKIGTQTNIRTYAPQKDIHKP